MSRATKQYGGWRPGLVVAGVAALVTVAAPLALAAPTDTADLGVDVTQSADVVGIHDVVTYTVEVTNAGPATAAGVTLRDVVVDKSEAAAGPAPLNITPTQGAHIDSATPSQGTCAIDNNPDGFGGSKVDRGYPNQVVCDLGSLASGSTVTVDIAVRPNLNTFVVIQDQGVIANVAAVTSDPTASTDTSLTDNVDTVTTTVVRT